MVVSSNGCLEMTNKEVPWHLKDEQVPKLFCALSHLPPKPCNGTHHEQKFPGSFRWEKSLFAAAVNDSVHPRTALSLCNATLGQSERCNSYHAALQQKKRATGTVRISVAPPPPIFLVKGNNRGYSQTHLSWNVSPVWPQRQMTKSRDTDMDQEKTLAGHLSAWGAVVC
jgi:hypothetical protein